MPPFSPRLCLKCLPLLSLQPDILPVHQHYLYPQCLLCSVVSTCRASHFSKVLENGTGSAAALAILYIEVCQRLALPMVRTKRLRQDALVAQRHQNNTMC